MNVTVAGSRAAGVAFLGTRAMRSIERAHPATKRSPDTPSDAVRNRHFYEKLGYVGEGPRDGLFLSAFEKQPGEKPLARGEGRPVHA